MSLKRINKGEMEHIAESDLYVCMWKGEMCSELLYIIINGIIQNSNSLFA